MDRGIVISIFGPTAVGKTAVAEIVRSRLRDGGQEVEAVSADAYAVYREIPIITGAPQSSEFDWRTVGQLSVTDEWSAGAFATDAKATIDTSLSKGGAVLMVGGTGLYLQAALSDLQMREAVPADVRAAMTARLEREGSEALHRELSDLQPDVASSIHPSDSHRVARALEGALLGQPPVGQAGIWTANLRQPTRLFGLTMERASLRERINSRIEGMIAAGAAEEVERAWELSPSRTAQAAIGMRELPEGDVERMKVRTHQFAKRQETWMRKLEHATILDVSDRSPESVADQILELLSRDPAA